MNAAQAREYSKLARDFISSSRQTEAEDGSKQREEALKKVHAEYALDFAKMTRDIINAAVEQGKSGCVIVLNSDLLGFYTAPESQEWWDKFEFKDEVEEIVEALRKDGFDAKINTALCLNRFYHFTSVDIMWGK